MRAQINEAQLGGSELAGTRYSFRPLAPERAPGPAYLPGASAAGGPSILR